MKNNVVDFPQVYSLYNDYIVIDKNDMEVIVKSVELMKKVYRRLTRRGNHAS